MKVDLNPKVGTDPTVKLHREYRFESKNYTWSWKAPDPGNPPRPDRDPAHHAASRNPGWNTRWVHAYDPSYDWPIFERYGFATLDDYVDNLPWTDRFSGRTHHFSATQFEYTVMLPITDPPAAAVPPAPAPNPVMKFYNFYPAAGSSAVMNLDETNANLFLIL